MGQLRYIYHPGYDFARGVPFVKQVHGFVLGKPSLIRRHLIEMGAARSGDFERPDPIAEKALSAIHSSEVMLGLRNSKAVAAAGELPSLAILPNALVRHALVKPQVRACGGTAQALAYAADGDWVFHLSGGFHHARPCLSHGFCLVNDVAWAVHALRASGVRRRILVLDLDLHQGDGNAAFFKDDEEVFTASLHQEDTFPIPKVPSDLDRGLSGAVDDHEYSRALDDLLSDISERVSPEIVIYVAGTDPYCDDAIGSFALSAEGLGARDERVANFTKRLGGGLVALPAGGYSTESPRISAQGFATMAEIHRTH
ncbi:MAG: histone deacetylase [Myxococcales bacterium]|nr:histone deacetylase [Myxococcales bacterium]